MIIIAFLGNPGKKYIKTRHNIGFIAGEFIADRHSIKLNRKAFSAETGTGKIRNREVLLLFPQTYMNESGKSVKSAMKYHKTEPANLIVVHDELELPFGEMRDKFGGGHKGHNGLRSIMAETGSPDFHRIRLGIGRPENPHISVSDHVLSSFSKAEMDELSVKMPDISDMIESIIEKID